MTLGSVNKPWLPFDDFQKHLSISVQLMNISPETELSKAAFAEAHGLGLLFALGDPDTRASDRIRIAVCLAKLSAKVVHRRGILLGILSSKSGIPDEIVANIDRATQLYWAVAKMANILHLIPQVKPALAWAISNSHPEPRVSEKKRICPPWRSEKLTDKMHEHYPAREVVSLKIWESRFPNWMKYVTKLFLHDDGNPKTPISPA